jgi:hypothetical protein
MDAKCNAESSVEETHCGRCGSPADPNSVGIEDCFDAELADRQEKAQ